MDAEVIDKTSTDVWTKGPIQRYEQRPAELDSLCLADFLAWGSPIRGKRKLENNSEDEDSVNDTDNDVAEANDDRIQFKYKLRLQCRVLRYRSYEPEDVNYKREMVLLFVPFRNEAADILDRNKFVDIFIQNQEAIVTKCKEYEANVDMRRVMNKIKLICDDKDV
jgi:hypothetical protein